MEAGIAQEQSSLVELTFTLNGDEMHTRVDGTKSLLRYVRDDLGLMGTKDGCSSGDCGSCVVLVDGTASP